MTGKNSRRNVNGYLKNKQGNRPESRKTTSMIQELRRVRKELALVTDKLKVMTKEKHDLVMSIQQATVAKSTVKDLQTQLGKERKKCVHLQSVVDDMFSAMESSLQNIRTRHKYR